MDTLTKTSAEQLAPADAASWHAVQTRDKTADGRFVYAVTSTGIYCRPSCPSRKPRRDRVALLRRARGCARGRVPRLQALQARRGGAGGRSVDRADPPRVRLSLERRGPSVAGDAGGASGRQPVSPAAQLQAAGRRDAARVRGGVSVCARSRDACAGPATSPARCWTPATDRAAASTSARCRSSGWRRRSIGAAAPGCRSATPSSIRRTRRSGGCWWRRPSRGVCAVAMGSSDAELTRALSREYPAAAISADAGALAQWTTAILAHLAGRTPRLDLPLDVQATAFQWQVWQALAAIPYGETRTYADVAASIGRPRAVRAVARACATNPVALAIPCHRVVPAAGGAGGYRWGAGRKKALLKSEVTKSEVQKAAADDRRRADASAIGSRRSTGPAVETSLEAQGFAALPALLDPDECASAGAPVSARTRRFRSRIDMSRFRFGVGEYKVLRGAAARGSCSRCAKSSTRGSRRSRTAGRSVSAGKPRSAVRSLHFLPRLADFLARCHERGQTRPTPLLLSYTAGGYNCLHQDIYGDVAFPLQAVFALTREEVDYQGGEFLLVEQRPRAQSRGHAVAHRPGRRHRLRHARAAGGGHARRLPGDDAPRRQHRDERVPHDPRRHLSRCTVGRAGRVGRVGRVGLAGQTEGSTRMSDDCRLTTDDCLRPDLPGSRRFRRPECRRTRRTAAPTPPMS